MLKVILVEIGILKFGVLLGGIVHVWLVSVHELQLLLEHFKLGLKATIRIALHPLRIILSSLGRPPSFLFSILAVLTLIALDLTQPHIVHLNVLLNF